MVPSPFYNSRKFKTFIKFITKYIQFFPELQEDVGSNYFLKFDPPDSYEYRSSFLLLLNTNFIFKYNIKRVKEIARRKKLKNTFFLKNT